MSDITKKLEVLGRKACVVMVTYNRCELLKEAISALNTQTISVGGICIVNNASTDGTKEWLDGQTQTNLHIVEMETNTGGAGGFHVGAKKAVELGYDFCWFLDDDAVAKSTALEELLSFHINYKQQYGFLCSSVVSDDGEPMNIPRISRKRNSTGYLDWPRYLKYKAVEVDSCTFVSCFIPSKTIKKLGLPIKEMFIWGDDTEYTTRISSKYNCFIIGSSIITHKRMLSDSLSIIKEKNPSRIKMYFNYYRNNTYNRRKYYSKKDFIKYFSLNLIKTPIQILFKSKDYRLFRIYTVVTAIFAGLFFKPKVIFTS